jgi:hypothetical protein
LKTGREHVANLVAERIEEVLRPIVGTVLAAVTVDLETKRIGKDRETLNGFDLPVLADNLAAQLRLVVGPDVAAAAAARVRGLALERARGIGGSSRGRARFKIPVVAV